MLVMMVKSLETLALEKLAINCKENQYEDEELKKSDLPEYCLIGTFLHSCDINNFFICECEKWGHSSKKRPCVICVCSIETWQYFLMIFLNLETCKSKCC